MAVVGGGVGVSGNIHRNGPSQVFLCPQQASICVLCVCVCVRNITLTYESLHMPINKNGDVIQKVYKKCL